MRNMILALALLISVPIVADMHVELQFSDQSRFFNDIRSKQFDVKVNIRKAGDHCTKLIGFGESKITTIVHAISEEGIKFTVEWFEKNNKDEYVLTSNPVFDVKWGNTKGFIYSTVANAGCPTAPKTYDSRLVTATVCKNVIGG